MFNLVGTLFWVYFFNDKSILEIISGFLKVAEIGGH
jgi:hypothetical protein